MINKLALTSLVLLGILIILGNLYKSLHECKLNYAALTYDLAIVTEELEAYKNKRPEVIEKIVVKYKEIQNKYEYSSCESTLNSAKESLRAFVTSNN